MSDGDCPARHTRSADLKRKPLPDMASRHLMADDRETDESPNTSFEFESATQSPEATTSPQGKQETVLTKSTASPGLKKRLYPGLDSPGGDDFDETDSSGMKNVPDTSPYSNKNQSAKKRSNAKPSPRTTGERVRANLYPPLEPVEDQPAEGGGIFNIIIVIGVIVVAVACYHLFYYPTPKVPGELSAADIFLQDFKELKNSFPSQDARFWKIIGGQVKRVLSNDSTYPAVILLGTPGGYEALGTCLAKRVISTLNNVVEMSGKMYIDIASLDRGSPAKTKFDLDQNLKSIFDESKGAIIDNVENLPAKAALLLHGYCDGDNAPYKDVVLFLMLHTDLTQDKLNDKVVEKSLTDLWGSELGVDEMPALCARIANNIVILTPEEDETLATCT